MKNKFDKINDLIARSKNILIASHRSPDEDAVGSSLALQLALKNQGINSSVYISGYSPKEYKFLPNHNVIKSKLDHHNYDLVFGLDYGNVQRLAIDDLLTENDPAIVTIDHHLGAGAKHVGEVKLVEPVSSTAEIIYNYLKQSRWPINKDIATCILTGIIGDTGGFIHANTSQQTLRVASELLYRGVQANKIINQTLNKTVVNNFELFGRLLSQVKTYPELDLGYLIVNKQDFESWYRSDLDNLVSTINTVQDCRWSLLLIEYEQGKTKGSLRSEEYKGVDVSKIASLFGGGGHKLSSGFRANGRPEKVFKKVIKKAREII